MKKYVPLLLCALLVLALAACQATATPTPTQSPTSAPTDTPTPAPTATPEPTPETALSGELSELLTQLQALSGLDFGMTFDQPIDTQTCQSYTGLTPEQFEQYVLEAEISMAAISTSAHQIVLMRCADAQTALTVKDLVAEGFDSGRWICVMPGQSFVVESGEYVLLVATRDESADPLKEAFAELAGSTGEVNVFFNGLDELAGPR